MSNSRNCFFVFTANYQIEINMLETITKVYNTDNSGWIKKNMTSQSMCMSCLLLKF